MELRRLSDTRWACREQALKALQRNLEAIMMLLNEICERNPPDLALGDAKMYKNAINFAFILCMEITSPAFEVTALASNALQEESLDHSTAYKLNDGVIHTVQALRSEEKFAEIFSRCVREGRGSQHSFTYCCAWSGADTESASAFPAQHNCIASE